MPGYDSGGTTIYNGANGGPFGGGAGGNTFVNTGQTGASGGFGGGGGGLLGPSGMLGGGSPGPGGIYGGAGGTAASLDDASGGGGGAALGGAIFTRTGGSLAFDPSTTSFSSNSIIAGSGGYGLRGGTSGVPGTGVGQDLYLNAGSSLTFNLQTGASVTMTNGIGGDTTATGGSVSMNRAGATLTLEGTSSYNQPTNVNAGTLIINGSIATSALTTVASGATIGGTGTVGPLTIDSGGFIAPGNSIGTINVVGPYIQSGTYNCEIANISGSADKINVTGTASIGISSLNIIADCGAYAPGLTYTILQSSGSLSGMFDTPTLTPPVNCPSFNLDIDQLQLVYNPSSVTLNVLTKPAILWVGGLTGHSEDMGNAGNWSTNVLPTSDDTVTFNSGTSYYSPTLNTTPSLLQFGDVFFNDNAQSYTVNINGGVELDIAGIAGSPNPGVLNNFSTFQQSFVVSGLGSSLKFTGNGASAAISNPVYYTVENSATLSFESNSTLGLANISVNSGTLSFKGSSATTEYAQGSVDLTSGILDVTNDTTNASPAFGITSFTSDLGSSIYLINTSNANHLGFQNAITNGSVTINTSSTGFTGTGTVVFNEANTYSGSTSVTGGALQAGIASAFSPNSDVSLTNTSTLDLAQYSNTIGSLTGSSGTIVTNSTGAAALTISSGGTFGGIIENGTGAFSLALTGSTLTLSGVNTYTGGTMINGGTISIGLPSGIADNSASTLTFGNSGGTLESIASMTLAESVLLTGIGTFNTAGHTVSLDGVISGSGSLIKAGAGTLILNSNSNNAGNWSTQVIGGILQVNSANNIGNETQPVTLSGGILDSINGFVSTAPFFVLGNSTMTTASTMNLSGTLTGSLAGTLNLTSGGDYSISNIAVGMNDSFTVIGNIRNAGSFTKSGGGKLNLSGTTSISTVAMISEGNLAVNGPMTAGTLTVNSGATLSGVGPFTGNVVIEAGGTMSPGNSPGTFVVNGSYTQDPGSIYLNEILSNISDKVQSSEDIYVGDAIFTLDPLGGPYSESYVVFQSTGGNIIGQFASFNSLDPRVIATLAYQPTLNPTEIILLLRNFLFTTNATRGNPSKVAAALDMIGLDVAGMDDIIADLVTLSPSEQHYALDQMHPALYKGAVIAQENNAVRVRDAVGYRFQMILDDFHCLVPSRQLDENSTAQCCEKQTQKVHAWATGFGDLLRQGNTTFYSSNQVGYNDNSGGAVAGIDYNFLEAFYVGALGAYTHSHLSWFNNHGKGNINTGYAGIYASGIGHMFYCNLSVIGDWSNYDEKRNIIYPGMNTTATNSHHGAQLISHLDTGINFGYKGFTIRPFDSFDFIVQNEAEYTEKGAGSLNLQVSKSHATLLRNELGLNFAACHCLDFGRLTLDGKLGWIREVRTCGKGYTSEFVNTTAPFTVIGYFPNRNLLSVGASLDGVMCNDLINFTLSYEGEFGKAYQNNTFGLQMGVGF